MVMEFGGFASLEINNGRHFYPKGIFLNTGRNCLEYIILANGIQEIYIPYYICDVVLEPIMRNKVNVIFFNISMNFEIVDSVKIPHDAFILYPNYFGLKTLYIKSLAVKFSNLIIDNSQAFFSPPIEKFNTFYSPRKFFGVPDGGILFAPKKISKEFPRDNSTQRFAHLINRVENGAEAAYVKFKESEESLSNQAIKKMSNLTNRILRGVNYRYVNNRRIHNFLFIHEILKKYNTFEIDTQLTEGPLAYPFKHPNVNLRNQLIKCKIFIPTYWENVKTRSGIKQPELELSCNTLALPIDQRYNQNHMKVISKIILKHV